METPSMLSPTANVVSSTPSIPFVHRFYLLLKAHYFLFFSAFGILYPVLSLTLRSRGLSNTEISYTNIIIPFVVFFVNPLLGYFADHSRRYLLAFNIVIGLTTILYCSLFMLQPIKTHHIRAKMLSDNELGHVLDFCASQEVATKCSSRLLCGCSYHASCMKETYSFNFTFTMKSTDTHQKFRNPIDMSDTSICGIEYRVPIDKFIQNYSSALLDNSENLSPSIICEITCSIAHYCQGTRYPHQGVIAFLYSLLFILGTTLLSNAITIGASIGFATLPSPDLFGQQRVWGTIGFGLSAFLASRLYELFHTEFVYIIMFSIATTLCIVITSFIRIQSDKHKQKSTNDDGDNNEQEMSDLSTKESSKNPTKKKKPIPRFKAAAIIPLLKKLDVIVFLSLTFIWGTSYAALDPYVFLYIDEIAPCQSRSIVGWMSLIAATSEVFALFLAGRMLKFFGTNFSSITILIAFSIRFSGYYFVRQPYFFIPIETMHYFNFGILYVLIAQKADAIAPPGLSGTLQGVVYGVSFGLGRGVGLIVGSFIYTRLQPRSLFLTFALYNAVAAIFYGIYFIIDKQRLKKSMRSNNIINVPKIVIESDTHINEEPLLSTTLANKTNEI